MNNSKIAQDSFEPEIPHDSKESARERETELVKILESLRTIIHSAEWSSLKELVFGKEQGKLKQELLHDSLSETPNPLKQRYLSGRLFQTKRYELEKLESTFHVELTNIRKLLYGKEE